MLYHISKAIQLHLASLSKWLCYNHVDTVSGIVAYQLGDKIL